MIVKNTTANQLLVRKMAAAVDRQVGYRAVVDKTWNLGNDIRFEIGTVLGEFIVSSWCTADGGFEIKLRLLQARFDADGAQALADRLARLNTMVLLLKDYVADAKPGASDFDS